MTWLIRAIVLLALFVGGYFVVERFTIYAFDPRLVAPDIPGVSETVFKNTAGKDMIVWTAEPKRGKPTILYLHGNAGNLANRSFRFGAFRDRGYGLIAPAYRGSSGSEGWPTENAIRKDILSLYGSLLNGSLMGQPIKPVIYGESIGAAIAIHLVADLDDPEDGPRAVVLEAPFTSLVDVAKSIQPELALLTGLMINRWNSIDYAPNLTQKLLILHGTNDTLIPLVQGREIFEQSGSTDKAFFPVEGAGHINVWKASAQRRLYQFLASVR